MSLILGAAAEGTRQIPPRASGGMMGKSGGDLQENASKYSWPQSLHFTRARPLCISTHF